MNLMEWTDSYITYLNCFKRDLKTKMAIDGGFSCDYNGKGNVDYLVTETLEDHVIQKISDGQIILVCLNSKANVKFMLDRWPEFAKNPKLKVLFSNPSANQQWSIVPFTHNKFADPASLKTGIKSLSESIPEYA